MAVCVCKWRPLCAWCGLPLLPPPSPFPFSLCLPRCPSLGGVCWSLEQNGRWKGVKRQRASTCLWQRTMHTRPRGRTQRAAAACSLLFVCLLVLFFNSASSPFVQPVKADCTPSAPANGAFGTCSPAANSLASGSTCLPVCFPPFVESGPSTCVGSTFTAAACAVCPLPGRQWNVPQTSQLALLRGDTTTNGQFGRALAFSANGAMLVIGAKSDNGAGSQSRRSATKHRCALQWLLAFRA
jgi:hypothetical protein